MHVVGCAHRAVIYSMGVQHRAQASSIFSAVLQRLACRLSGVSVPNQKNDCPLLYRTWLASFITIRPFLTLEDTDINRVIRKEQNQLILNSKRLTKKFREVDEFSSNYTPTVSDSLL